MDHKDKVFREERLQLILEKLIHEKKVVVSDLVKYFNVSPSLIRMDLAELEKRDLILRTHGGAILPENPSEDLIVEKKFLELREETNAEAKAKIGLATINLINDGDAVIIDGGSTAYAVAKNLKSKRGLTIITTSIHLLPILLDIPDAKIYLTGGLIHREMEDLIGDISFDSIGRFAPDIAIMGIDGVSISKGFTTTEPTIAPLKRKMIAVSKKSVVVSDSTKFGKVCLLHIADINEVDAIVTDKNCSGEFVNEIEKSGTTVILA
ncbi:MAG: DeoR/GlpR transcriptional regulator [Anaerolineae bacterium]|jgi:DeoR/GlpR family transcriptional regulator of sugar metabolism|nr:DeoR/GlpR transcriptional regulator [Anaerolineae bacterium]